MRRFFIITTFFFLCFLELQAQYRKEIDIPDIPGYLTLKCDFHMRTVFSEGEVWPTDRVSEAWEQGLDALAITDKVEFRTRNAETRPDHNQSYEIARPLAEQRGIILIRGAELSFRNLPGHFDAIFVKNANLLERENWKDAFQEAKDQGAFVFWDHPETESSQPEEPQRWTWENLLLQSGVIGGVEVFSGHDFYPEVLNWARKKELTILATSDMADKIDHTSGPDSVSRPVTLVFATERKVESIRYALQNNRTAIYFEGKLLGDAKFLSPIFQGSIKVVNQFLNLKNHESKFLRIHNNSDIDFSLSRRKTAVGYSYQREVVLKAHRTTLIEVIGTSDEIKDQAILKLEYDVKNLMTAPGEKLQVAIEVDNL